MIKRVFPFLFFFFLFSNISTAQKELLHKDVPSQQLRNDDEREYGYNGRNFIEGFYGWGVMIPLSQDDSLAMMRGMRSFSLEMGIRYRRKMGTRLALGWDARVSRASYRIEQSATSNLLGFGAAHKSQKLIINTLHFEPFFRTGLSTRGMVFARSIDLGLDLAWVWYSRLMTKDLVDPQLNNGARRVKYSAINNDYINILQTSLSLRYGVNETAFWVKYRISDMFTPTSSVRNGAKLPELSPLVMGFEINTLKFKRKKDMPSEKP